MKIIITNKQYNTLVENITKNQAIDEGIGELIKATIGRFSKKKSLSKQPIDVSVRNVFTRDLNADITKRDKEFPNDIREVEFTNSLLRIKAVYDTIRLCAYLSPFDPEHLPVDDVNWAIDTLIQYIYQIYHKNLKSIYKSSRGKKLLELIDSMKRVKDSEIPVHKKQQAPPYRKNVPRGTSKKSTPPKSAPYKPKPKPTPASQPEITKGEKMWLKTSSATRLVIVLTPNIKNGESEVRYDGEVNPFIVYNDNLHPL
jgi:hypothetical protein